MPARLALRGEERIAQKSGRVLNGTHTFRVGKKQEKTNSRLNLYTEFCVHNDGLNVKLIAKDDPESC